MAPPSSDLKGGERRGRTVCAAHGVKKYHNLFEDGAQELRSNTVRQRHSIALSGRNAGEDFGRAQAPHRHLAGQLDILIRHRTKWKAVSVWSAEC